MISDILAMFTMQELVMSRCNLAKYPNLYSHPEKNLKIQNNH